MAKQQFPGLKSGSGLLSKVIVGALALAVLVLVVKYPSDAASWAQGVGSVAADTIDGLVTFFRGLGN
ncbi:hypothetical protein [Amycolatopsis ultiminotia]